jgi:hypothetical protein
MHRARVHEGHDEEDQPVALLHRMDGDDVRVRQPRRRARLAQEALARRRLGGQRRRQQLDRDGAVQRHVARQEDDAHAAAAELAVERVAAGDGGLEVEELGGEGGHGCF